MRKLMIVGLILLLAASTVFAGEGATSKGTWTVGSSLGTSGGAGTSIGYFYYDNMEFGGGFNYRSTTSNSVTSSSFALSAGTNYYLDMMGPGQPFGHFALGYQSSDNSVTTVSGAMLEFGVGYQMFLKENIAWTGHINYEIGTGDLDYNILNVGVGLKVFVF